MEEKYKKKVIKWNNSRFYRLFNWRLRWDSSFRKALQDYKRRNLSTVDKKEKSIMEQSNHNNVQTESQTTSMEFSRMEKRKQGYINVLKQDWTAIYDIKDKYLDEDVFLVALEANGFLINDDRFEKFKENPEIVNKALLQLFSNPDCWDGVKNQNKDAMKKETVGIYLKENFTDRQLSNFFLNKENMQYCKEASKTYVLGKFESLREEENKTGKFKTTEDFNNLANKLKDDIQSNIDILDSGLKFYDNILSERKTIENKLLKDLGL